MSELFPEISKGARKSDEPAPEPTTTGAGTVAVTLGPTGQALEGAAQARETWRQLLGIDALGAQDNRLRLQRVVLRLEDGQIELTLQGARIGSLLVRLHPLRLQEDPRLRVSVSLAGTIDSEAVQQTLNYIQQRLAPAPYASLVKAIRRDPQARSVAATPAAPAEPGGDQQFVRSVVRTNAGGDAWRIFHAELEQQRNFNYHLSGRILVVRHEDLECSFATPPLQDDLLGFFNYGAYHTARQPRGDEDPSPGWGELTTDLQERDIISGGTGRMEALLERVAQADELPELIILKTSCVPTVIGEDLSGIAARFEQRTGVPTVLLDNLADEESDFFSVLAQRLYGAAHEADGDDAPVERHRRINLVGFPADREMDRLVEILEMADLRVNARVVPEVRLDALRRLDRAELQVFLDSHLYRATFRQIRGFADIRAHYSVPPYGRDGSLRWLESIAGELGDTADVREAFNAAWEPFASAWEQLTARARNHSLGFVLDHRAVQLLEDPALTVGVPVLAMIQEMGFGLELLLYEDVDADVALGSTHARFSTPGELATRLRESTATAFYSELYYDRRLSRSGKAQFSIADLQLGLGGAVATLRRLLRIAELPFYRRHADALGSPFTAAELERA